MRLRSKLRARAMTALALMTTALTATTVTSLTPAAAAATHAPITFKLAERQLPYGAAIVARGEIRGAEAAQPLVLERRGASGTWTEVARGTSDARGAYALRAIARRSGALRVRLVAPATVAGTASMSPAAPASRAHAIRVAAQLTLDGARMTVNAGRLARIAGRVHPARAGLVMLLQRRAGRGWRTLTRAHSRAGGRFVLRYRTGSAFSAPLRVRTAKPTGLERATRAAGRITVLRQALASWYGEGQSLACGGTLSQSTTGVANKSLPCGTMVTIRYRGRQVRVPVVDRGPYVGNREFDLTPGTRRALGFDGVGTIRVAVG